MTFHLFFVTFLLPNYFRILQQSLHHHVRIHQWRDNDKQRAVAISIITMAADTRKYLRDLGNSCVSAAYNQGRPAFA